MWELGASEGLETPGWTTGLVPFHGSICWSSPWASTGKMLRSSMPLGWKAWIKATQPAKGSWALASRTAKLIH